MPAMARVAQSASQNSRLRICSTAALPTDAGSGNASFSAYGPKEVTTSHSTSQTAIPSSPYPTWAPIDSD